MQRATLFAVCFACLPSLSGCVVPYAFPKLDFTRALQLDAPPGDVRVFRVDIAQAKLGPPTVAALEHLSEIPVRVNGKVSPQFKSSLPRGVYLFMGALNYDFGTSGSLALRAYRPGFELVEVRSMERTDQLVWTPAADLAAQERVLDLLFPLGQRDESQGGKRVMASGAASAAHRQALLFGAAEYERLAATANSHPDQIRLVQKGCQLKDRALE